LKNLSFLNEKEGDLPKRKPQLLQHIAIPTHDWVKALNKEDVD